eukprot:COSAG01_NODE_4603_length_4884_cov_31.141902_3_plen_132_part_00
MHALSMIDPFPQRQEMWAVCWLLVARWCTLHARCRRGWAGAGAQAPTRRLPLLGPLTVVSWLTCTAAPRACLGACVHFRRASQQEERLDVHTRGQTWPTTAQPPSLLVMEAVRRELQLLSAQEAVAVRPEQ